MLQPLLGTRVFLRRPRGWSRFEKNVHHDLRSSQNPETAARVPDQPKSDVGRAKHRRSRVPSHQTERLDPCPRYDCIHNDGRLFVTVERKEARMDNMEVALEPQETMAK